MNQTPITPRKRDGRSKWDINYHIPGYSKTFCESFDTKEEADLRVAEIALERSRGTLRPPEKEICKKHTKTLSEYLDEYIENYAATHWGDSQYSVCTKQIRDYIQPSKLGSLLLKDIRTSDVDRFYQDLLTTPVVLRPGHKDTGKTVGCGVIEKIHATLRAALNQAVKWGYLDRNPTIGATIPKMEHKEREVWTPQEAVRALNACTWFLLKVCLLLGIACSMRIGEVLGLQWDCVNITEESLIDNTSTLRIKQELKRCEKKALAAIEAHNKNSIYFVFPERKVKNPCSTVLVLKSTKTNSSRRTVYIPNTVAQALLELKRQQDEEKRKAGDCYHDYNLVFAMPDGRPVEERLIAKAMKELCVENDLPVVVFHSLRHLSTSMKLQYSGGDIKAVQGDTGHSQARMVMNVYSHTFDANRKHVADLMEKNFFDTGEKTPSEDKKIEQVMSLLKEKPELADLLLLLAEKTG